MNLNDPAGLGKDFHKGPLYRDYVAEIVKKKNARNYMEIGVREGFCISGIDVPTLGIDPFFQFACNPVSNKKVLHLFQMGSDEFFRDYDPRAFFQGNPIDVAFLDGLHQFEFLLRDFINTEKYSSRSSLILLDDCLPVNVEMTERQHVPTARQDTELAGWWTGDVWKVVSILRKYRPDLKLLPFNTTPTGNVMVTNLDPTSTILSERYFDIIQEFHSVELTDGSLSDFMRLNEPIDASKMLSHMDYSLYFLP